MKRVREEKVAVSTGPTQNPINAELKSKVTGDPTHEFITASAAKPANRFPIRRNSAPSVAPSGAGASGVWQSPLRFGGCIESRLFSCECHCLPGVCHPRRRLFRSCGGGQ